MKNRAFVTLLAGAGVGISVTAATAEPIEDFYQGKTVNLIVAAGAGGGYSSYATAFAPYLSAHLPGKPHVVVQNMPGAGGVRAMLYFQSVAPRDGTAIGFVLAGAPLAPLYGIPGAKFDPRTMNWLGSLNATSAICVVWYASAIKTWQDVFEKEFTVGSSGAGSAMETIPSVLNKFFGTRIKIVSGYKGGNEIWLAMERGEVDGRCAGLVSSIKSTRPDWLPQKKVRVPIAIGFERNPLFPDAPAIAEFGKDERSLQVLRLLLAPEGMDRPFFTPPDVPAERVAALRAAFHAAANDPGFRADAAKMGLEINEVEGEKVAKILRDTYAVPAEVVKLASEAMKMGGARSE